VTAHLIGDARTKAAADLRAQYEAGASIRQIAYNTGHSAGRVRTLLLEAGTTLRPPGVLRGGGIRSRT
jgi:Helix-turn-helix domain